MSTLKHAARSVLLAGIFLAGCAGTEPTYDKAGFTTEVKEGRLWVFKAESKEYQDFKKNGELSKQVTRVGEGPDGMTLKAPDAKVLDEYLAAK